jgi:hypothetical protein
METTSTDIGSISSDELRRRIASLTGEYDAVLTSMSASFLKIENIRSMIGPLVQELAKREEP